MGVNGRLKGLASRMGVNWVYYRLMLWADTLQITPEILSLIARGDEFKGAWRALGTLAPDRLLALRRAATIESIGSSTRVDGSRLSVEFARQHGRVTMGEGDRADRCQPQHAQAALPHAGRTGLPEPTRRGSRRVVRAALNEVSDASSIPSWRARSLGDARYDIPHRARDVRPLPP
jgi:hypothetical protein